MSKDVVFSLATRDDDEGIRALVAETPLPGRIRIRLQREPDYFAGCATMGPFTQVLVAKERDRVVGVACRAVRTLYVNGAREDVGYLSQLRVHPSYRGLALVQRGFRKLRELHEDGRAGSYLTTIVEGNEEAEGVLVKHRRGAMPRYRFLERLITLAVSVPKRTVPWTAAVPAAGAAASRAAAPERRDAARPAGEDAGGPLAFLERHGARRNFFPVWNDDFDPRDFVVVQRDGAIAGVAGLWDQSAWKQTVVDGYDGLLSAARPLYNFAALLMRKAPLPRAGSVLRLTYGSFFCVSDDDPALTRELVGNLLQLASARGMERLLLGFAESDPCLAAARAFRHIAYPSSIYTVAWDGDDLLDRLDIRLDSRPRYLELAML
jgi:acetyltransferase (GNAT) family protein